MLVRCAKYMGTVAPENQQAFDDYVRNVHLPDVATWPRLQGLRLLKCNNQPYLGEAPRFYHTFELAFANQADMDYCMASEARRLTRKQSAEDIGKFKGLFAGDVYHVNYEVIDFPTGGRR